MPSKIKYAYLKERTWMFRRNYPQDVALVLGSKALKQSLKTGDPRAASARASEVNAHFERQVEKVRSGLESVTETGSSRFEWDEPSRGALVRLRSALEAEASEFGTVAFPQGSLPGLAPSFLFKTPPQ